MSFPTLDVSSSDPKTKGKSKTENPNKEANPNWWSAYLNQPPPWPPTTLLLTHFISSNQLVWKGSSRVLPVSHFWPGFDTLSSPSLRPIDKAESWDSAPACNDSRPRLGFASEQKRYLATEDVRLDVLCSAKEWYLGFVNIHSFLFLSACSH